MNENNIMISSRFVVIVVVIILSLGGFLIAKNKETTYGKSNPEKCDGLEILSRGNELLEKGDVSSAGLYFSKALACDQGNMELIKKYSELIVSYADKMEDRDKALGVIADLEVFLRNQAPLLPYEDLQMLADEIELISRKRAEMMEGLEDGKAYVDSAAGSGAQGGFGSLSEFAGSMLKAMETDAARSVNDDSSYVMYRLGIVENTLQKMLLLAEAEKSAERKKITKNFISQFNELKSRMGKAISEKKFSELKGLYEKYSNAKEVLPLESCLADDGCEPLPVNDDCSEKGPLQKQIDNRLAFSRISVNRVSQITDQTYQYRALALIQKNNREIQELRKRQNKKYVEWAIGQMKEFRNKYIEATEVILNPKDIKIKTNTQLLLNAMREHLAPIDTLLLGRDAMVSYNELFSLAYEKLSGEWRIKIGYKMSQEPKKKLCTY